VSRTPPDEPFIRAIADQPRDGLHRAVHADWLDDHGRPERAELIRAQCELERLDPASARALVSRRRAVDLLAEHESEWMGEWAERLVRWEWRAGYPHAATIEADAWARHGDALMRAFPLSKLAFVDREGEPIPAEAVEGVVRHPAFAAVRSLKTESGGWEGSFYSNPQRRWVYRDWVRCLAGLPERGWLEELYLADSGGQGERCPTGEMAGAVALSGLRSLSLDCITTFNDDDLETLARAPFALSLRRLDLPSSGITPEGVAFLASAPTFSGLRRLGLTGCRTGVEGLHAVLSSSILSRVTSLGMDFEQDLPALARSPRLGRFTELELYTFEEGASPGTVDWRLLADALGEAGAPALRSLRLEMSDVSHQALRALLSSPGMAGLRRLRLRSMYEAERLPWERVLTPEAFPHLAELELESCRFRGTGWLAGWPGLARLRRLRLGAMDGIDGHLQALLASPFFGENLEQLALSNSEDDDALEPETLLALAACPRLGMLRDLALDWQDVPATFVEALAAAPLARHLTRLQLTGHAHCRVEAEALADVRLLPRLRDLSVSRLPGGDAARGAARAVRPAPADVESVTRCVGIASTVN